jgi:hypothetical protein
MGDAMKQAQARPRLRHAPAVAGCVFVLCLCLNSALGVILFRTADPAQNTTAPTNDPAASGWNYEGRFGSFLGTPIAPHYFISAKHIGQADPHFVIDGNIYTIVTNFADPYSDLNIWQVAETFPSSVIAPLYSKGNETGLRLIAIGRGTRRGDAIFLGADLRGWAWGLDDGVQRWGENVVADIVKLTTGLNDALYATFDKVGPGLPGLPDECHLSGGDSGGAVFIQDNGVWKLAGINYGVDGPLYTDDMGNGHFTAALFDMRGYYYSNGVDPPDYVQITGDDAIASGFYPTRISSKLAWIYSVLDPAGDANGDGVSNLLGYATALNAPLPRGYGEPTVTLENGALVFVYRRITNAPSLQYQLEQSSDLGSWMPAASQDEILITLENVQTVKARVAIPPNTPRMFLRLKISQSNGRATSSRAVYRTRSAR